MESFALRDGRPLRRDFDETKASNRLHHRSSRLPTPETSRCSNEALDGHSPQDQGSPSYDQSPQHDTYPLRYGLDKTTYRQHIHHESCVPTRPSYWATDTHKTTLPPIKAVLGDSISSPPRTPSPGQPLPQASPREPNFTFSTYKPPALYPSKKQKTLQPVDAPPFDQTTNNLPRFLFPTEDTEPKTGSRPSTGHASLISASSRPEGGSMRRPSLQPLDTLNLGSPLPWETRTSPFSKHITPSSNRSVFDLANGQCRSPKQTPLSPTFKSVLPVSAGCMQDSRLYDSHRSHLPANDRPGLRTLSYRSCEDFASTFQHQYRMRYLPFHHDTRVSIPHGDRFAYNPDDLHPRQTGHPMSHGGRPFDPSRDPSDMSRMFASNHYEHQHGKARKRSNLPKQSTEIMKNWFDQNLANPYPSEEQKAIFSNATGISMTQVSNWFINHRRRCPELRDKRERTRASSRERGA